MKFIETKRLILRDYEEEDILKLAEINEDEIVMEFFPRPYDLVETQDFVVSQNEQMREKKFGFFAVEEKKTKRFIGFVGLNKPDFQASFMPAIEIGWRLDHAKWNQGFATEAAKAVLEYGFDEIGLEEIVSFTASINLKSRKIMEKIGMKYDEKYDFIHPKIQPGHRLAKHVLYRIKK